MIVYGRNVANEVINGKKKINKAFVVEKFNDRGILDFLENNNIIVEKLSKNEINRLYGSNTQGIILDIEDYKYHQLEESFDSNFIVMLDHLEDPHNFGAIIRTCEAAGVDYIIIPKDRSVSVNSTVMKVSAGALNNVKIIEVNNLVNALEILKDHGFWVYSTDMQGEDYSKIDYDDKSVIIIGAEGNGVSRLVSKKSDFIISIPMKGTINSLNASVAAGIIIFDVANKRK